MSGANIAPSSLGGGPYKGWSPQQTVLNYKSNQNVIERKLVTRGWNSVAATGAINGKSRIVTPFRAVNSLGDFLGRQNYVCGGANEVNVKRAGVLGKGVIRGIISHCDGSGVPANSGNNKFVADGSDYIRYKRLRAANQTYNDLKNGGNKNHAEYVSRMAAHRGIGGTN